MRRSCDSATHSWARMMGRSKSLFSLMNGDPLKPTDDEGRRRPKRSLFHAWRTASVPFLEVTIVVGMILGTFLAGYGIYRVTQSAGEELVNPSHKRLGPSFDAAP